MTDWWGEDAWLHPGSPVNKERKCEDCCNRQEPSFLHLCYGITDLRCMTAPPWVVACIDPNECEWFNVKPKERLGGPPPASSYGEGYQDENRTTTNVERVYETRYDCGAMPGGARLAA